MPDSKSGGSDTVRVRPPLPAPVKALVSASAFRLFGISYIRRWRSWITQQIPILKNGGSNPFRRAKSKTSQNHAFLRCKGRFIVLILCQKMSGNNRKNLNYICIMQTRCRYEIFLVCFFVVKTTRARILSLSVWHPLRFCAVCNRSLRLKTSVHRTVDFHHQVITCRAHKQRA